MSEQKPQSLMEKLKSARSSMPAQLEKVLKEQNAESNVATGMASSAESVATYVAPVVVKEIDEALAAKFQYVYEDRRPLRRVIPASGVPIVAVNGYFYINEEHKELMDHYVKSGMVKEVG